MVRNSVMVEGVILINIGSSLDKYRGNRAREIVSKQLGIGKDYLRLKE